MEPSVPRERASAPLWLAFSAWAVPVAFRGQMPAPPREFRPADPRIHWDASGRHSLAGDRVAKTPQAPSPSRSQRLTCTGQGDYEERARRAEMSSWAGAATKPPRAAPPAGHMRLRPPLRRPAPSIPGRLHTSSHALEPRRYLS